MFVILEAPDLIGCNVLRCAAPLHAACHSWGVKLQLLTSTNPIRTQSLALGTCKAVLNTYGSAATAPAGFPAPSCWLPPMAPLSDQAGPAEQFLSSFACLNPLSIACIRALGLSMQTLVAAAAGGMLPQSADAAVEAGRFVAPGHQVSATSVSANTVPVFLDRAPGWLTRHVPTHSLQLLAAQLQKPLPQVIDPQVLQDLTPPPRQPQQVQHLAPIIPVQAEPQQIHQHQLQQQPVMLMQQHQLLQQQQEQQQQALQQPGMAHPPGMGMSLADSSDDEQPGFSLCHGTAYVAPARSFMMDAAAGAGACSDEEEMDGDAPAANASAGIQVLMQAQHAASRKHAGRTHAVPHQAAVPARSMSHPNADAGADMHDIPRQWGFGRTAGRKRPTHNGMTGAPVTNFEEQQPVSYELSLSDEMDNSPPQQLHPGQPCSITGPTMTAAAHQQPFTLRPAQKTAWLLQDLEEPEAAAVTSLRRQPRGIQLVARPTGFAAHGRGGGNATLKHMMRETGLLSDDEDDDFDLGQGSGQNLGMPADVAGQHPLMQQQLHRQQQARLRRGHNGHGGAGISTGNAGMQVQCAASSLDQGSSWDGGDELVRAQLSSVCSLLTLLAS